MDVNTLKWISIYFFYFFGSLGSYFRGLVTIILIFFGSLGSYFSGLVTIILIFLAALTATLAALSLSSFTILQPCDYLFFLFRQSLVRECTQTWLSSFQRQLISPVNRVSTNIIIVNRVRYIKLSWWWIYHDDKKIPKSKLIYLSFLITTLSQFLRRLLISSVNRVSTNIIIVNRVRYIKLSWWWRYHDDKKYPKANL